MSVLQLTYSLTRFAIYETVKKSLTKDGRVMPFYEKVLLASFAGASGGLVGTPADLVNVRYVCAYMFFFFFVIIFNISFVFRQILTKFKYSNS